MHTHTHTQAHTNANAVCPLLSLSFICSALFHNFPSSNSSSHFPPLLRPPKVPASSSHTQVRARHHAVLSFAVAASHVRLTARPVPVHTLWLTPLAWAWAWAVQAHAVNRVQRFGVGARLHVRWRCPVRQTRHPSAWMWSGRSRPVRPSGAGILSRRRGLHICVVCCVVCCVLLCVFCCV